MDDKQKYWDEKIKESVQALEDARKHLHDAQLSLQEAYADYYKVLEDAARDMM